MVASYPVDETIRDIIWGKGPLAPDIILQTWEEKIMPDTAAGTRSAFQTKDIVLIGIFAALIAVCSWISIPTAVPFTLQTFGVFMAVEVLGGKRGTLSVLVYLLLGAVGLPVFAGFTGGMGIITGSTGGYIVGFLLGAMIMWLLETVLPNGTVTGILSMLAGLLVCYALGTLWFMWVFTRSSGPVSLMTVLGWCVIPFIIPDLIKIALAWILSRRLRRYV